MVQEWRESEGWAVGARLLALHVDALVEVRFEGAVEPGLVLSVSGRRAHDMDFCGKK